MLQYRLLNKGSVTWKIIHRVEVVLKQLIHADWWPSNGGRQNPESRNPDRSKSRQSKSRTGQNPEGSKSRMGQNPE
ncbi:hypothetical protein M513_06316 [Trichuris suis]|uniref:Uncharacterized protein n=1 Tax=Trichuris suis TaxID=68888 RepID=A0A085M6H9_9BILA|nr:hypothetical protein M513_06316 [Trichuris suis]